MVGTREEWFLMESTGRLELAVWITPLTVKTASEKCVSLRHFHESRYSTQYSGAMEIHTILYGLFFVVKAFVFPRLRVHKT